MQYERVVVAIDLSKESEKILKKAVSISGGKLSGLHVLHVIEPMPVYPYETHLPSLQNVHEQLGAESGKHLKEYADRVNIPNENQHVLLGSSSSEICNFAEETDAQLIVLGSHGISGWRALLGSTANSVIQTADCDVLTIRVGDKNGS